MKAPYSWLNEYTDLKGTTTEIADMFTALGLEVEKVEGAYSPIKGIKIGKVIENIPHPNADKLTINKVDIGTEVLDIVCGAPNVREGLTIALATNGTDFGDGFKIKKSKIRGEVSNGMICSERELGISDSHEGIMELSDCELGEDFSDKHYKSDPMFEIDVLANRPDCLGILGLSREIGGKLNSDFNKPEIKITENSESVKDKISVSINNKKDCPRYTARYITGIKIEESPLWLQKRLLSVGLRPINNIVDITNFVMMEYGQPLHAFDSNLVKDGKINVRSANKGEEFDALTGQKLTLRESDLLICDGDNKAIALAGIVGGANSEVKNDTENIILESAYFDAVTIRMSSRELGVSTDSSYRFERGVDPNTIEQALNRATSLICEIAGGTSAIGFIDEYPETIKELELDISANRINKLLGTEIKDSEMQTMLESIEFKCKINNQDSMTVIAPTFRPDIEKESDIAEEVARIFGYNNIPESPNISISAAAVENKSDILKAKIRSRLVGMGLNEIWTNSLVSNEDLDSIKDTKARLPLMNPLSPEMSILRTSLLASQLSVVRHNLNRKNEDLMLFELSKEFIANNIDELPKEIEVLAGVATGKASKINFDGSTKDVDFFTVKGIVNSLILSITGLEAKYAVTEKYGSKGAVFSINKKEIGSILVISSGVLKKFDIKKEIFYFELDLKSLLKFADREISYTALSKFPAVDRDLSIIIKEDVEVAKIINLVKQQSKLIESVTVFDIFRDESIGLDKKAVAFSFRIQSIDKTLKDVEIQEIFNKVIKKLQKNLQADLR